jgi:DNA-binding CsgD family transcriptional regulator
MHATRAAGALSALRVAMVSRATVDTLFGRFRDAEVDNAATIDLTRALGGNPDFYALHALQLAAWRGHDAAVRPACEAILRAHDQSPDVPSVAHTCGMHLLVLDVSSGRYADALVHARRLFVEDPPQFGAYALPSMVEIAIRAGDQEFARDAYERLELRAECSGTPWALGLLARSRALLVDDSRAEARYDEAIQLLDETSVATDIARAELLYGEWLRRQKRRSDARNHLRRAFELFDDMGARGFADRASRELVATGEHVRRDPIESRRELTPQEMQVARLAAARATNREIAAQMFISANTVEYHLRKVFRKLGVTSRRELEAALPQ